MPKSPDRPGRVVMPALRMDIAEGQSGAVCNSGDIKNHSHTPVSHNGCRREALTLLEIGGKRLHYYLFKVQHAIDNQSVLIGTEAENDNV